MDVFKAAAVSATLFFVSTNLFAETAYDRVRTFFDTNGAAQVVELGDQVVWSGKCVTPSNPNTLVPVQMPVFISNDPIFGSGKTFAFILNENPWSNAQDIRYAQNEVSDAGGAIQPYEPDLVMNAIVQHTSRYYSRQERRYKGPYDVAMRSNNTNDRLTLIASFIYSDSLSTYCYFSNIMAK
jgi:hypothetical protein